MIYLQADLVDLNKGYNYVVYSLALLIWEILPTVIVTVFFRVQKPSNISTEVSKSIAICPIIDVPQEHWSQQLIHVSIGMVHF